MAVNYKFIKRYENFNGVDYKSSDLHFPEQYATGLRNLKFTPSGSMEKRKGYQGAASNRGGSGLFTFKKYDSIGQESFEVVAVDSNLWRLTENTLTIAYSGSAAPCLSYVFLDSSIGAYRFQILEGSNTVLNLSLGLGIDEASPVTLTALRNAINALPGFTATVTGSGTVPAAFLETQVDVDLLSGNFSGVARSWTQVNSPGTLFPGNATYKNDSSFENTSSVQLQNCLYLSNGYDEVIKYDGQNAYRAGVPTPASITAAASANASGFTGDNYVYKVQYLQKDAQGNETAGNWIATDPAISIPVGTPSQIAVTVANILAASGFNTNCAVVNGAQSLVTTITVDNGSGSAHTLKIGDTAYFYDAVTAGYVERQVTGISPTTITIAGAAVTVADNAVISNNLRIILWRSKNSATYPTVFYSVAEIPNNSFSATQSYIDLKADTALGAVFIEPETDRSPPVKGRYISAYQNIMVTAGNLQFPNQVSFSDVESPEYFSVPDNSFQVSDLLGDRITGISPSNEFFIVFQSRAIHSISGDLSTLQFRVDQVANDIGCAAHATIKDISGALAFLSFNGPRVLQGGQVPRGLGPFDGNTNISRIDPIFEQRGETDSQKLWQFKRAVGFHDRVGQKYLCFVPCETDVGGQREANSSSLIFVYDYPRDAWLEWDHINAAGGITELQNELLFSERKYYQSLLTAGSYLYRFHTSNTAYDYADNASPISFYWKSAWDFFGEASVLKNFLAIRLFSTEDTSSEFDLDVQTEVNWIKEPYSTLAVTIGGGGYGQDAYNVDPWGSPSEPTLTRKLNNNRVKSLRVVFSNEELQKNILLTGYELEVATPYKPRFVR